MVAPPEQNEPLSVEVKLLYRKFDTIYLNYVFDKNYTNGAPLTVTNNLPITTIASDKVTFPVEEHTSDNPSRITRHESQLIILNSQLSTIPEWQRWNDYGIGLLLEGERGSEKGELIQAAEAFAQVEKLG